MLSTTRALIKADEQVEAHQNSNKHLLKCVHDNYGVLDGIGKYNVQVKGLYGRDNDLSLADSNSAAVLVEPSYVRAIQGIDNETEKMLMVEKSKKTAKYLRRCV